MIVICIEAYMFSYITTNSRLALTSYQLKQPIGYNDDTVKVLERIKARDNGFFRINKSYFTDLAKHKSLNDSLIQGFYGTSSYYQFNQKYYIRFLAETGIIKDDIEDMTRWTTGLTSRPLLQTLASVKYNLSKTKIKDFTTHSYRPYLKYNTVTAYINKYFLPLGFTYKRYVEYDKFKNLNRLQKDMTLLKSCVVEGDIKDLHDFESFNIDTLKEQYTYSEYGDDIDELRKDAMVLAYHSQNKIKGKIQLDSRKLIFFSIPFDKGWALKIDGKAHSLRLVNLGFMGAIIPKGFHEVELIFSPPFLLPGIIIMICAFILYIFLLIKKRGWCRRDFKIILADT